MESLSEEQQQIVEKRFHSYCLSVLRNEACDIHREYTRQQKRETFLEDLTVEELLELSVKENFEKPTVFVVGEYRIPICDENLAVALMRLEERKRELILLYFFLDKTDREIALLHNTIRRTITHRRKRILEQLKDYLQMED